MSVASGELSKLTSSAAFRRGELIADAETTAFRAFSGEAEGVPGLYADVLGPALVANVYEGTPAGEVAEETLADALLEAYGRARVRGVYVKRFPRDRSKLAAAPSEMSEPRPTAGETVEATLTVFEHGVPLLVKPYDGFSTGLFVDQRENRHWVRHRLAAVLRERAERGDDSAEPARALNAFAYTGGFGVNMALAGRDAARPVATTNADVSPRYLEWARENYASAGVDAGEHFFTRADARGFFDLAEKKAWRFSMVVLDPPSFGSADKRRGVRAWRIARDFGPLAGRAAALLEPGGVLLCSTNNAGLAAPGELEGVLARGLNGKPTGDGFACREGRYRFEELPMCGEDVALERGRFASLALRRDG
mgnify:CR=1 FL=1